MEIVRNSEKGTSIRELSEHTKKKEETDEDDDFNIDVGDIDYTS